MLVNNYQKYQQNAVMTAAPGDLTLMLYNGAIKFCNLGIEGIETKNIKKAHESMVKVQNIIVELQSTLDSKYPVSEQMNSLYDFIKRLVSEANIYKDTERLGQAKELIVEFRDMWQQVMKQAR
ncbi:MAG: flagellar protein FliS [Anaerocolumna sp.]|jgi:flagellar protein FliS|nr:flagellar protein FliS [Anaerocolumna sp.]